jgi:hypothetical protein
MRTQVRKAVTGYRVRLINFDYYANGAQFYPSLTDAQIAARKTGFQCAVEHTDWNMGTLRTRVIGSFCPLSGWSIR